MQMDLRDQFQHLKVKLIVVTFSSPKYKHTLEKTSKILLLMFTWFTCEYESVRKAALCDLILLILSRDSKVTGVYKN